MPPDLPDPLAPPGPAPLRRATQFTLLTLTLSVATILFFQSRWPRAEILVLVNMLTPLMAALIMLFVVTREGYSAEGRSSLGLRRAALRWWPAALLLPLPVLVLSYGGTWAAGLARPVPPADWAGPLDILRTFLPNLLGAIVLVFGEEFGFRGYLLPRLLGLGARRAVLISGLFHGIWHLPLILLTPFYPTEGDIRVVVLLFLLTLTAAGVVYGYLRLASGSLWPPTLFHAAFNAIWDLFRVSSIAIAPVAAQYVGGEAGLLTFLGTALAAAYCLRRLPASGV